MKKARFMLTTISVFAIISGTFAFKVNKFGAVRIYTPNASGICNVQVLGKTTTNVGVELVSASSTPLTTTCTRTFTTISL